MQDGARIVNVGTIVLALATAWLAFDTHRMASATGRLLALEERPFLTFQILKYSCVKPSPTSSVGTVQFGIVLKNPSRVITRYSVTNLSISVNGRVAEHPHYGNTGAAIYPGDIGIYWCYPIENVERPEGPKRGVISYTIEYSSLGKKASYTSHRKMDYVQTGSEVRWITIEESDQ